MPKNHKVVALAGGVGASKLLVGFRDVMDSRDLTIVVNTGDDIVLHGLYISPDIDIVTYTLAGIVNPATGWGIHRDTFHTLRQLSVLGRAAWFHLGDRDLATHIFRTEQMKQGKTLSEVTEAIRISLRVKAKIIPMSDHPVPTLIRCSDGFIHFQEYLVQRRAKPKIVDIRFEGSENSRPSSGVEDAIAKADRIIVCPSNPLISIGPILAVPGIRASLRYRKNAVLSVCPIVGGKSLKGPSDKMLRQLGHQPTAAGVASLYADFSGTFVIDPVDKAYEREISRKGMKVAVIPTVMKTIGQKRRLARALLSF